jgi:PilZ domain
MDITTRERRSEKRHQLHQPIIVKIMFASESPHLLGKRLQGSTADVSASGVKILLNTALSEDSTIDMTITLNDSTTYFLSGKVRWTSAASIPGMFEIGISLQDLFNTDTDLKRWKDAIKALQ